MINEPQPLGIDRRAYLTALDAMEHYVAEHGEMTDAAGHDPQAAARLPEYEQALRMLQNAVANDKRDLAEAEAAAKALAELEAAIGTAPDEAEIHAARQHLADLKAERATLTAKLADHQNAERQAAQADEKSARAFNHHMDVGEWVHLAHALAPDGIPGEMLAEALTPLNHRLEQSAQDAEWMRVHVEPDMSIGAAYPAQAARPYALLSESEQWRADAMLAEAIATLSKLKLLVLDRFDVLDLKGRADLIAWLDILAQAGDLDTALLFGTLKALPTHLPPTVAAHWLENGAVGQLREAA